MYKILNILKWSFNWNIVYTFLMVKTYSWRGGICQCTERVRITFRRSEGNTPLEETLGPNEGERRGLGWMGSNPWLAALRRREIRNRSHTLVWQQAQNWVLFPEREGRFTKAERAEERVVPQRWGKGPIDWLWSIDWGTVASDGGKNDKCLVDNFFFNGTKGKQIWIVHLSF